MEAVRSLTVGVWVRVGSRHETPADAGMSHFLEHAVFKGTETRDAFAIASSLESVGGHLDAFTGREVTCFQARVLSEHLPLALDVLSDLLLRPCFDLDEVEKEKRVILEEIHQYDDTPDDRVHDLFADVVLQGHPLGNRILGSETSVSGIDIHAIRAFHGRHYRASNMIVAIAGHFDWEETVAEMGERFAQAPNGPATAATPRPGGDRGVVHHVEDLAQQYLCLGAPGLPHEDPDRYALALLTNLLGGGMSSRLFQRVREEAGLAYSVFTYLDSYSDAGIFCASMYMQPSQGRRALDITLREFDRVLAGDVSQSELDSVKEQARGGLLLGLESSPGRMGRIARSELYAGRYVPIEDVLARIDRITVDDIVRVGHSVLTRDRLSLVALGGVDDRAYDASDLEISA